MPVPRRLPDNCRNSSDIFSYGLIIITFGSITVVSLSFQVSIQSALDRGVASLKSLFQCLLINVTHK